MDCEKQSAKETFAKTGWDHFRGAKKASGFSVCDPDIPVYYPPLPWIVIYWYRCNNIHTVLSGRTIYYCHFGCRHGFPFTDAWRLRLLLLVGHECALGYWTVHLRSHCWWIAPQFILGLSEFAVFFFGMPQSSNELSHVPNHRNLYIQVTWYEPNICHI